MVAVLDDITEDTLRADPFPVYARLRREAPVAWVRSVGAWLVTDWAGVRQVIESPETFASVDPFVSEYCGPVTILTLEGDAHAGIRASVDDRFTPETALALDGVTAVTAAYALAGLGTGEVDLIEAYFKPVSAVVLAHALGLDMVAPEELMRWSDGLTPSPEGPVRPEEDARIRAAAAAIDAALTPTVSRLTTTPDGSVLSRLIHGGRPPGRPRGADEVLATLKMLMVSFREPAMAAANTLHALLAHPGQLAAVRSDPALLDGAVREGLRWNPPVGTTDRMTSAPVRLGEYVLPAGERIVVVTASANRDESVFPDPETFDVRRPPAPLLTFGYGRHRCLVRALVPRIVRMSLGVLLDGRPRIVPGSGGPAVMRGWRTRMPDRLVVEF
ncbi:cytochrome P450 [Streptomyces niveiscabiei]|uniref:cytochrome P450 n=1 Tax=Streptomyces niveiscabiei TaxID=164115 RepID=UPI0029A64E7C|nr:cytochrome P450 [Streptomyces niveiscabiei]MDX3386024.1 cytochrome P450 [Streptomyces niveiscabiei]